MKKESRVCRNCRTFVNGDKCAACGGTDFSSTYAGVAVVIDPSASEVAKKMGVELPGKYALKVR